MSALGHKRTFAPQKLMSAWSQKRTFAVQLPMSAMSQQRTFRGAIVAKEDRAAHLLLSRVITLCTY
jgi:hypothetical protein